MKGVSYDELSRDFFWIMCSSQYVILAFITVLKGKNS